MVQYKGDITRSKVTSDKKVSILKNKVTTKRYSKKQIHNLYYNVSIVRNKATIVIYKVAIVKKERKSHLEYIKIKF